jgi:hypothetical protein
MTGLAVFAERNILDWWIIAAAVRGWGKVNLTVTAERRTNACSRVARTRESDLRYLHSRR